MDGSNDFLSGGVNSLEGFSVDALDPLVVNEPEKEILVLL
jgi:hypothetical protein